MKGSEIATTSIHKTYHMASVHSKTKLENADVRHRLEMGHKHRHEIEILVSYISRRERHKKKGELTY